MTLQSVSNFLLWCAVLNYAVLLAWFVAFRLAHAWMRGLHGRWFHISEERFDGIHTRAWRSTRLAFFSSALCPTSPFASCRFLPDDLTFGTRP